MNGLRLTYLGNLVCGDRTSPRIWNVTSPELPGYNLRKGCYPTFTLEGLKEAGLL
jgi:hypothetical protein